jgi:hypothetical protein
MRHSQALDKVQRTAERSQGSGLVATSPRRNRLCILPLDHVCDPQAEAARMVSPRVACAHAGNCSRTNGRWVRALQHRELPACSHEHLRVGVKLLRFVVERREDQAFPRLRIVEVRERVAQRDADAVIQLDTELTRPRRCLPQPIVQRREVVRIGERLRRRRPPVRAEQAQARAEQVDMYPRVPAVSTAATLSVALTHS